MEAGDGWWGMVGVVGGGGGWQGRESDGGMIS